MIKHTIKILTVLLFFSSILTAQTEPDTSSAVQLNDSTFVMTKSPWGAVLRSAVLPGWGQFYNKSYWKIPIVWGALGYFVYQYIDNNNLYEDYRDLYSESLKQSSAGNPAYKRLREFYRDERDSFAIYFGLGYLLNLIDAYVDAQLFDFSVGENKFTGKPELKIRINLR